MSDVDRKKLTEKKVFPSNLKGNAKNNYNSGTESKKDNISLNKKKTKIASVNNAVNNRKTEKNKNKKKNDIDLSFHYSFKKGTFLCDPKILNNFLSFFNIRELFIIMEIDYHIQQAIINSDVFKKYLTIRKDFILKDTINKKLNKKNKNTKNNNVNIMIDNKNKEKSISRKYYEKYDKSNIVDPVTLGVNGVLVVYPTKAGERERLEKEMNEDKNEAADYYEESFAKQKLELNLPALDFSKLELTNLLYNNSQNIKKYIKSLSLNNFQSHSIFNGILEYLLMKQNGIPNEKSEAKIFSLQDSRALIGLSYYTECLINLDYPSIIKLDLSNVGITSTLIMKKLCYIFHKYAYTLRIINLSNNSIDDKCAKLLFPGLQSSYVLEYLNISKNNIGIDGLKFGENFFSANKSLKTLIFEHNLMGPIGGDCLFKYLISNPYLNLIAFEIGYNGLTHEGTELLVEFIKKNDKLITFNIGGNYFCDEGIKEICESMSQSTSKSKLSYVDFQNNNITKLGCEYLYQMLIDSPFLNGICLKNNFLNNEGVCKIFSALSNDDSNIISLDLSDTKMDEKSLSFISEKLNKSYILEKLILSNNNFKRAGINIKNLLLKETNLKHLVLSYCDINTQFNLIFQGLSKNKNLKTIDFSGNNIPMKNPLLRELSYVLGGNKNLENLIMDDCNIDDIGMSFINKGLEINHTLKSLSLNCNYVTMKSIHGLLYSIEKSKIIKKVNLNQNNGLNVKYINEIEKALSLNENNFVPKTDDSNE